MPHKNKDKAKEYFAQRYEREREVWRARNKKNYQANKEAHLLRSRKAHLKNTYGLSVEEFNALIIEQNNRCAICFKEETATDKNGKLKPLCVDHCHTTGKIRALLCNSCNCMLGFSKDDTATLFAAIQYLKKHEK